MHPSHTTDPIGAVSAHPVAGEIACQQILTDDNSIYSVQWLVLPERCAELVSANLLLDRYLEFVRRFTWSLVRPFRTADSIEFRLAGTPLAFLSFATPGSFRGEAAAHLRIRGGLLVQGEDFGRGIFSFLTEREAGGVRITLQLAHFRPLLLGRGHPSALRRLFFSSTQGLLHRAITVRFLRGVYRELTGDAVPLRLKKVQVRQGIDI